MIWKNEEGKEAEIWINLSTLLRLVTISLNHRPSKISSVLIWCQYKDRAAGYPIILTILGSWVRRLTIVGFLDSFTMGKCFFPS